MIVAIVDNNVVNTIQIIDESQYSVLGMSHQAVIDITDMAIQPQVGWSFNGSTLITNGTNNTLITKLAFRERFTMAELVAILTASQTNMVLQVMLQNQSLALFIDLARSDTQAGVQYLVSQGLLTSARANTILTTPPSAIEVYNP